MRRDPWNWGEPLGWHKLLGHAWVTEIQDDRSRMLPRTPFFWGASELTIWDLIGLVNTTAFVVTNQKDEPITSGLLVIRPESMPSACSMEIPAKLDARSEESRTAFRDDPEHHRSVATLATRLCGKVFGFVKRNLSGAQRRMDAASGQRGAGKGGRPCPASAHSSLERE